jgi:hypothetical protein
MPQSLMIPLMIASLAASGVGMGLEMSNRPSAPKIPPTPPGPPPITPAQAAQNRQYQEGAIMQNIPNVQAMDPYLTGAGLASAASSGLPGVGQPGFQSAALQAAMQAGGGLNPAVASVFGLGPQSPITGLASATRPFVPAGMSANEPALQPGTSALTDFVNTVLRT